MKAHCLIPWTNFDLTPAGEIRPCCKFSMESYNETFNINSSSLEQYSSSAFLNKIKNQMLEGQWPDGCYRCKLEESNQIKSKRQLDYERWQKEFDSYDSKLGFLTADVSFGNTCNLKCITCNPTSSSKWRKESIDIYNVDQLPVETLDTTVDELHASMKNIIHLDIGGGEPFLSEIKKQQALLQRWIDSGQSKDITIHYTTNAQIFADLSWWDLWNNFKQVEIQLSIDGVGDRYEYIRHPASKDRLQANVWKYLEKTFTTENLKLSVSHTVSAYNIYYLDEFFTWCEDTGLPTPWCGVVQKPAHMRPSVFPFKDKIVKHSQTSKHNEVNHWADLVNNTDDTQHYQDFLVYKDKHDIYRSTVFSKTFPEVQELIDGV